MPVLVKSRGQKIVSISITEGERGAGTTYAQDMLYIMRIIESVELKVKKSIKLTLDNKSAVDLAHNWSEGGQTMHEDIKDHFLRELKEEGLIETQWASGSENRAGMLSKNVTKA